MSTIVTTAENFAFGPTGRLLTVLKYLKKKHTLIFVGSGTAFQLASRESFDETHQLETSSKEFAEKATPIFRNADLLVSSLDRPSVVLASDLGIPVIYIDGLFWRWEKIPKYLQNVECYIKQSSLLENRVSLKNSQQIKNLHEVGPIVDPSPKLDPGRQNVILVNLGGMEAFGWYKVGKDTNYPYIFTDILIKMVNFDGYKEAIFTGNERIINQLRKMYPPKSVSKSVCKLKFKCLSHDDFLSQLANSSAIITTPGGQTSLEAFTYQIPVIFLPPSNDTQYMWLDSFISENCGITSIHLKDFFKPIQFKNKNFRSTIQLLFNQIKKFESDRVLKKDVAYKINSFLHNQSLLRKQLKAQNKYLKKLGGNGSYKTCQLIEKTIKKYQPRQPA